MHTSEKIPYVHKFETAAFKYVYDVRTMSITRVDPVIWAIIDDVGPLELDGILATYGDRWGTDAVRKAYTEVVDAQRQHGLFLATRPEPGLYWSEEDIKAQYQRNRMILILNVTARCNYACAYCTNELRSRTMMAKRSYVIS